MSCVGLHPCVFFVFVFFAKGLGFTVRKRIHLCIMPGSEAGFGWVSGGSAESQLLGIFRIFLAGIRTPAKKNIFFAWSVENNGDPKKAKTQKGEVILGKS